MLEREVDPGDPVVPLTSFQEGTELASIADMADLIFKGTVDEIDVGKLSEGVPARLNVGALPGADGNQATFKADIDPYLRGNANFPTCPVGCCVELLPVPRVCS